LLVFCWSFAGLLLVFLLIQVAGAAVA